MNYFFLIVALLCIVLLSDLLDGKIARKTKKVTIIGTYLDAISDYSLLILLSSTFFLNSLMPWWLWTGIITRFSFTAIMTIILSRSKKLSTINPTFFGKFSVAIVMLTIVLELINYSNFTSIAIFLTLGKNFGILNFIEISTLIIVILSVADKIYYIFNLNQE